MFSRRYWVGTVCTRIAANISRIQKVGSFGKTFNEICSYLHFFCWFFKMKTSVLQNETLVINESSSTFFGLFQGGELRKQIIGGKCESSFTALHRIKTCKSSQSADTKKYLLDWKKFAKNVENFFLSSKLIFHKMENRKRK